MAHLKLIFRNRLFVVGLHVAVWSIFLFLPFFIYRIRILHPLFMTREIVDNLFLIGLFYLNFYVLIPRFFTLKKIIYYLGCILFLLVFIIVEQAVTEYYFVRMMFDEGPAFRAVVEEFPDSTGKRVTFARPRAFMEYRGVRGGDRVFFSTPKSRAFFLSKRVRALQSYANDSAVVIGAGGMMAATIPVPRDSIPKAGFVQSVPAIAMARLGPSGFLQHLLFPEVLRKSVFAALLMLFMSGFIKIAQEWFKSEQQKEALKVENLNAELKFLKSQINPHFLFNCLNTIYSLAHKHSAQTEHAIVKLSTIMRYMIYESNEDKVQLQQELQYLQDYIDIQRLRLPAGIQVGYTVSGSSAGLGIEPMLLIPFVENAFKHGISYAEHSFIDIAVTIERNIVRLLVKNSLFRERVSEKGGIGLQNVLKRLELLYDNNHEIAITETDNQFIADLKIVLKND
jgi:two-component system LytT family sensor kinase